MRAFPVLPFLFLLAACGFQPMYGNPSYRQSLTGVVIAPMQEREGQLFKQKLEDQINPAAERGENRYVLAPAVKIQKTAVAINQDRRVSRFNIDIIATYQLKDMAGNMLRKGTMHRITSFNVVPSEFATYIAEQDAVDRALTELAVRMTQEVASLIASGV